MVRKLCLEVAHAVRHPEMCGLGVIREHAHAVFDQAVEFVEQVRVDAHSGCDGEVAESRKIGEITVVDSSDSDPLRYGGEKGMSGSVRSQRKPEVVRHSICGPERDDSKRRFPPRQTLEHIVNSAVTSASDDGVAAFANRHADLCCGIG